MEKLKMLQSPEPGETNRATWHHLTSEGCSFPKNCFLQSSVIPYVQSQSIFNGLRFPPEHVNPLQKALFFTVVPSRTSCVWAVRQEGLKEHSPLLPIAEEHPREAMQHLCWMQMESLAGHDCSIWFAKAERYRFGFTADVGSKLIRENTFTWNSEE